MTKLHKKYDLSSMDKATKKDFKHLCTQLVDSGYAEMLGKADEVVFYEEGKRTLSRMSLYGKELLLEQDGKRKWVHIIHLLHDRLPKYPVPPKKRKVLIEETGPKVAEAVFAASAEVLKKYEEQTGLSINATQELELDIS